jgi:polysaccharide chain length determinant protein (PEP-CTERM system associated)
MIKNGEITLTEAKRILRRYWWILPLTVIGCGALGLLAAIVLPKRYTSQTLVLVDQPTVPTEYVRPVVSEELNHRLASMQEQILSRTRLQPIIEKFGLYAQDRGRVHIEDLVERLRNSVTVKPLEPMAGTQNRSLPGFYVNVTFDNALTAQQICTEITSMFMEQNTKERERQASQTTSFLSGQLDEAKSKLDEQDAKLAQFKRLHLGSLPEEEQANLSQLTVMNSQLEASIQAVSRAQQEKALNESLLSQQEATWKMSQTGQNPETAEQQLIALQDQLSGLLARYTPEHPDVIKVNHQIEELKKHMAEAPKTSGQGSVSTHASAIEPPQIQQLRAKLRQDEVSISSLAKRQSQIQDQIHQLQARIQASPVVEQQFKEMTRSHQAALDFYNDLLKKHEQSAMATDLEHQQQSEQFRVLDPPSLPEKPSFPKKPYFAGGGLGGGLVLGVGLLYLIALTDKSMHTEKDVELFLKLPVLAMVPMLELARSGKSDTLPAGSSYEKASSRR